MKKMLGDLNDLNRAAKRMMQINAVMIVINCIVVVLNVWYLYSQR